jgi:hypothetical protein
MGQYKFYAFISYKREDESWAKWLQHKLEYYKLPVEVRRENPDLKDGIRPIFKDTTDLEPGLLKEKIRSALSDSQYLIVICSPRAANSEWVSKEVQTFIDSGRSDKIIPFIIGGEPNATNPENECFPKGLRQLVGAQEILGANINEMGRNAAAIKVISRMFNVRFDTLWQRYERERRKKQYGIILFAIFALVLAIGVGLLYIDRERAYSSLSQANIELKSAYSNLKRTSKKLEIANDSIELKNKLLDGQNKNIIAINDKLVETNNLLEIEKDNAIAANNKMIDEHIKLKCKVIDDYIDDGRLLPALKELGGLTNLYHENAPYFIPVASDEICKLQPKLYDPKYKNVDFLGVNSEYFHISPYGRWCAFANGGTFSVYDYWNSECYSLEGSDLHEYFDYTFQFSDDNTLLFGGGDTKLYCWDLNSKKLVKTVDVNSDMYDIHNGVYRDTIVNPIYESLYETILSKKWDSYNRMFKTFIGVDSLQYIAYTDIKGNTQANECSEVFYKGYNFDYNPVEPVLAYSNNDTLRIDYLVDTELDLWGHNNQIIPLENSNSSLLFWPSGNELSVDDYVFSSRNIPINKLQFKREKNFRSKISTSRTNPFTQDDPILNWTLVDQYGQSKLFAVSDSTFSQYTIFRYLGSDIKLRYDNKDKIAYFSPYNIYMNIWRIPRLLDAFILDENRVLCVSSVGAPSIYNVDTGQYTYLPYSYLLNSIESNYPMYFGTAVGHLYNYCIADDRKIFIMWNEFITVYDLDSGCILFDGDAIFPADELEDDCTVLDTEMCYDSKSHTIYLYEKNDCNETTCYAARVPSFADLYNYVSKYRINNNYVKPMKLEL